MFKYKSIINELKQHLSEERLLIFCGAGISSDPPTCLPLFKCYKKGVIDLLAGFLSKHDNLILKDYIDILKKGNFPPEKFIQGIYYEWGEKALNFTNFFNNKQFQSNINHKIISELTKNGLKIILTTNFDEQIESEFSKYDLEVFKNKSTFKQLLKELQSNRKSQKPMLVKLHGSAGDHDEIIITLDQVGKPNPEIQSLFSFLLERYVFLFIGYSGRDFDLFPIILESSKRDQPIYWVFYPGNRKNEFDIENQLKIEYKEKFKPIEIEANTLLQKLLPKNQQKVFMKLQKKYDKEKYNEPSQKKWKNIVKKDVQNHISDVDIRRIYTIFAGFALFLGELDAEEDFLKAAWKVNEKAEDHRGMALTASSFVYLYNSQLLKYGGQFSETILLRSLENIKNWREKLHDHGKLTEDIFIKGEILMSDGFHAFFYENDLTKADQFIQEAIKNYEQIANEYHGGKDNLIGTAYLNIGHCYINSSLNPKTGIVNKQKAEKAIDFFNKAELCFNRVGSIGNLAETSFFFGKCYLYKARYNDANNEFTKALKNYETINDLLGQAQAYKAIGYTYCYKQNLSKALINIKKSSELFNILNDNRCSDDVNQQIKKIEKQITYICYNILPNVVANLKNIVDLLEIKGKFKETKLLYKIFISLNRILYKADIQTLNKNYYNVAEVMNMQVELLCMQDKDAKVKPLYIRALEILKNYKDIIYVATVMNNLAGLFEVHGKYIEAELLYNDALEIRVDQFGQEHPDVAQSKNNLAELYRVQRKYAEAEQIYKQAIEIWGKTLGNKDPQVAYGLNNLALLHEEQGNYSIAKSLYQQAVEILVMKYGKHHQITQAVYNNFVSFLNKMNSLEKRKKLENLYNILPPGNF